MSELTIGKPAPQVCLLDHKNDQFCLTDAKGKWIVLYFYPKDNTSGCTLEAQEFTKLKKEFEKLGAIVYGVSPDTVDSHAKFIKKQKLSVPLLSDPRKEVLDAYGVWVEKTMYGKKYMGVERTTYLIDPDGVVKFVWEKVKALGHAKDVFRKIKEFQNQ